MSRISKLKATELSEVLLTKKYKELKDLETSLKTYCFVEAEKRIPIQILKMIEDPTYSDFFKKTNNVRFYNGEDRVCSDLSKGLPTKKW